MNSGTGWFSSIPFCSGGRWRGRSTTHLASSGESVYTEFPHCSCGETLPEMAGTGEPFPPAAALCSSPAQVDPYLPYEYTCEGMLERIHAYIQHQVRHRPCSAGEGTPGPWRFLGDTPGAGHRRFIGNRRYLGAGGERLGVRGRGRIKAFQPEHPAVPPSPPPPPFP